MGVSPTSRETIDVGHHYVKNNHVWLGCRNCLKSLRTIEREHHVVALEFQCSGQRSAYAFVIFGDQDSTHVQSVYVGSVQYPMSGS